MPPKTCQKVGTPKACPKKPNKPFYVTQLKAPKALLGPFLSEADAERGRVVMRNADAQITACLIASLDALTNWHAMNNGQVCRALAGADSQRAARND